MQTEVKDSKGSTIFIEVELSVEELEEVIAPGIWENHNETLVGNEVELVIEEVEKVIAPRIAINHNEVVEIDLSVEELEEIIAPGLTTLNHNETFIGAEVELSVEVMEEVIAPKLSANHNETLAYDAAL